MKNIISLCIFLINIISYTNAQYGNTTNNCFYANSRDVFRGTVATAIQINGANLNEFLSTCCDYCRTLPNCVLWRYYNTQCTFYSDVTQFTASNGIYTGHKSSIPYWTTVEEENKWYFESSLQWTYINSYSRKSQCSEECFFNFHNCKSWMYNSYTLECYHSSLNYSVYKSVYMLGVYTGYIYKNFQKLG